MRVGVVLSVGTGESTGVGVEVGTGSGVFVGTAVGAKSVTGKGVGNGTDVGVAAGLHPINRMDTLTKTNRNNKRDMASSLMQTPGVLRIFLKRKVAEHGLPPMGHK